MINLYRKNKLGVGTWRIWPEGNVIVIAHAQVEGGKEIVHREAVPAGLAGRSLDEQVMLRIRSRCKRQMDRGYVESLDVATNSPLTNQLDLPPPMLAKKIKDLKRWDGPGVIQPKLDGFRLLTARNVEDEVIGYSRGGLELPALEHIYRELNETLPPDVILDGEIYEHGTPLQTIASLAKKLQPGTSRLVYHVYDCISAEGFERRYAEADRAVREASTDSIVMVPNHSVTTMDQVWEWFRHYRGLGFEGAMFRRIDMPYESGTRSSGLYKVKAREDAEFKVVAIEEDANGNALLTLQLENNRQFKTSAPGTFGEKKFVLNRRVDYIDRWVTVEYAYLTQDGIPFHAVATRWRESL